MKAVLKAKAPRLLTPEEARELLPDRHREKYGDKGWALITARKTPALPSEYWIG